MAEGREPEEGKAPDDLFDDLDRFFEPIGDVEWPEGKAGTESGADAGTKSGADAGGEAPPAEPTAELRGEDWRRLRDVLGDDEGGAELDDVIEPLTPARPRG